MTTPHHIGRGSRCRRSGIRGRIDRAGPHTPSSRMTHRYLVPLAGALVTPLLASAQNDVPPAAETPAAAWRFDAADEHGVPKSAAKFRAPGPQAPTYPAFPSANAAMAFTAANPGLT